MTLATHALVGTAAAELFPSHPFIAFLAAFSSHFIIDSFPHWDYKLASLKEDRRNPLETDMFFSDRNFIRDLLKVTADAILGLILSFLLFFFLFPTSSIFIIFLGVVGGILPDPLQFLYWKSHSQLLLPIQKFHIYIQKNRSLKVSPWKGISWQFLLVIIITAIIYIVSRF